MCTKCGSSLDLEIEKASKDRIQTGDLECNKCSTSFKIIDDIICFESISEKGLDKKIKKVREMFFGQELGKKWLKFFSKKELAALKEEWKWMISKLNLKNSKIHLDWASGTGRFLRNILSLVKGEIVALENDYATCIGLRDFLKEIKGYSRTTIIYGDARNMPLSDNSIDSASSWHGLDEPRINKALDEAKRVLKNGKVLAVSGLFFKENSKSLKVALEEGIEFAKKDKTYQYFKKLGFKDIDYKTFFEGKWTEGDSFLPKKGDYYTPYAVAGRKSDCIIKP
jgi:ubiquinone/menaquinone biosynthesis C-methylase UbiE